MKKTENEITFQIKREEEEHYKVEIKSSNPKKDKDFSKSIEKWSLLPRHNEKPLSKEELKSFIETLQAFISAYIPSIEDVHITPTIVKFKKEYEHGFIFNPEIPHEALEYCEAVDINKIGFKLKELLDIRFKKS